ncbi:MAG: U32 family peptidase [Firmicutes bacterium]|nr:U32 family peptidase [Bacillota bacterium]
MKETCALTDIRVKPELLAPAGTLEKLRFACIYGADAVYIGGTSFSLRAAAGNFSIEEMREGCAFAHSMGKQVFLAVNVFARNNDIDELESYLLQVADAGIDALIIADPGVFSTARRVISQVPVHISTQANNVNFATCDFWQAAGAERIVLGRELSLVEAEDISRRCTIPTEIFVHGAMCVSYSGRCLLSSYLTGRDGNRGACTQPCRWKYAICEESRPGVYMPVEEDSHGTYIMNSKDLCLLEQLPQLMQGGHASWKIEGRNKSAYYVANVVRIYRAAIDAYLREGDNYFCRPEWMEELQKVSHREYCTGFALDAPNGDSFRYGDGGYVRGWDFCAIAERQENGGLWLEQRNHLAIGDKLELLLADGRNLPLTIASMADEQGMSISKAPHPRQKVFIRTTEPLPQLQLPLIIRRNVK